MSDAQGGASDAVSSPVMYMYIPLALSNKHIHLLHLILQYPPLASLTKRWHGRLKGQRRSVCPIV